jgi:hypothetical protein
VRSEPQHLTRRIVGLPCVSNNLRNDKLSGFIAFSPTCACYRAAGDSIYSLIRFARLPTLVQYDPASRFFEMHEGTLVVSGENSVPLVRYHIADKGGVLSYDGMWNFLSKHGVQSLG